MPGLRFCPQDTSQKTDDWLEKYNQETVLFQSQLDKLKAARAMDLATYQKIAADVSERRSDLVYETSLSSPRTSSRCTNKSCEKIARRKNVVAVNSNVSNNSCTLLSKYNHGGVECSFVIPSGRTRRRRKAKRARRRRNRKHCSLAFILFSPFTILIYFAK